MRLLQSGLSRLPPTKTPQRRFMTQLLALMLLLPGHATFRKMSRDRPYHERTLARWDDTALAWGARNQSAITEVVPPAHDQAWVIDASVGAKSGPQTDGLDRFWNGRQSRTEKGRAISTLAWLDLPRNCADGLSGEQTPPSAAPADPQATRRAGSLDQLPRVVKPHDVRFLRYVVTDGAYSQQNCVAGVRALALHQIGTLRAEAHLRDL